MSGLATTEAARLRVLEGVVERGMASFVEVGRALCEIRDSRLYREDFTTFESYCRERWGFSRQRAHQLIDASDVSTIVDKPPATESQARPLTRLKDPQEQREAWAEAVETAPRGVVTAAHVERVVVQRTANLKPMKPERKPIPPRPVALVTLPKDDAEQVVGVLATVMEWPYVVAIADAIYRSNERREVDGH